MKFHYPVLVCFLISFRAAKAQLVKPCMTYQDKFTGVVSKTFFTEVGGGTVLVAGGIIGNEPMISITLKGQLARNAGEKFTSQIGDSCIVIQRSGARTRLMAKSKSDYNKEASLLGITYFIDTETFRDFINDPPTDIGLFGSPFHIPLPIQKWEQKLIPKAIDCFFRL